MTVPTIDWCIIPIAIVALIATFAAIQEGYSISTGYEILQGTEVISETHFFILMIAFQLNWLYLWEISN